MKMRNYYLLMLFLCGVGAVFGGFMLIFGISPTFPLRLLLWAATLCYMLAAMRYKRRFDEEEKRQRETRRRRREKNYPENSFYKGIRRSV